MATKEELWQILKGVGFPGFRNHSVLGIVKALDINGQGEVTIRLAIAHLGRDAQRAVVEAIDAALSPVPGVTLLRAEIVPMAPIAPPRPERPTIRTVLAVGSGKGGVGKSTIAVNLAVGLAQQGLQVGLLDADIFGPNVPRMLGVTELPPKSGAGIPPAEVHGVKFVSVGLLVQTDQAVVWRGPMTDKVMRQFLHDVTWGELDVLVVDLPPGTGDIAIALGKHAQPDGAIVVVTPQGVALDDARKAITMFRRLSIPVLGVVENMSYFACPDCGTRHTLFGEGGGHLLATEAGIPLLGEVPMEPHVREGGDSGAPAVLRPESEAGAALRAIATHIAAGLLTPIPPAE